MAKSTREIYNELMAEKATQSELSSITTINDSQQLITQLQSTSKVGRFNLLIWVIAYAIRYCCIIIEALTKETTLGRPDWYRKIALEFQYGDQLEIINNVPQYPIINNAARIIKYVSVVDAGGESLIYKVAAQSSGVPVPLSTPQKLAFEEYIKRKKFPGYIQIVSMQADDIVIGFDIYYDALIIAPDGSLINNSSIKPVEDKIKNYLVNYTQNNFNGKFHADDLLIEIKKTPGVKNCVPLILKAKPYYESSSNYTDILAAVDDAYTPESGYFKVSAAPGETLADTLNYLAS